MKYLVFLIVFAFNLNAQVFDFNSLTNSDKNQLRNGFDDFGKEPKSYDNILVADTVHLMFIDLIRKDLSLKGISTNNARISFTFCMLSNGKLIIKVNDNNLVNLKNEIISSASKHVQTFTSYIKPNRAYYANVWVNLTELKP